MSGYNQVSLLNFIETYGEQGANKIIAPFSCPYNKDVEHYLHNTAITFAQQKIAPTTLVFTSYKGQEELIGYYTLANRSITVDTHTALKSNAMRKRMTKHATYDASCKAHRLSAPLIAQIGKNFSNGLNTLISGSELLQLACNKAREAQELIGGCYVYLECDDSPKLLEFYDRNQFYEIGKRLLDRDEVELIKGQYLIQMIKHIK